MSPLPSGDGGRQMPWQQTGAKKNVLGGDRARVDKMLADYLKSVNATYVLLVNREGELLTMQGERSDQVDMLMVAALAAGSYEVSRQIAKALRKQEFGVVYEEGPTDTFQVSLVGEKTLLAVLFDQRATLGMVRLYAQKLAAQLAPILDR
jgi:predicted regulator of Ras-like GTPase activity (Roadblock/LC7/MglB family)